MNIFFIVEYLCSPFFRLAPFEDIKSLPAEVDMKKKIEEKEQEKEPSKAGEGDESWRSVEVMSLNRCIAVWVKVAQV